MSNKICNYCQSNNIIKYGSYKETQIYLCKNCGHRFTSLGHIPKMHASTKVITAALNMYYAGKSYTEIRNSLAQQNDFKSRVSAYNWIERFTDLVAKEIEKYQPKVGDTWIVNEDYIRADEQKPMDYRWKGDNWVVFWDVIDTDTCFLLASQVIKTRCTKTTMVENARFLIEKASKYAGKTPKVVVIKKLKTCLDVFELAYGKNISYTGVRPFEVKEDNDLFERFHDSLMERTEKSRRDLKNNDFLKTFMGRWQLHYNYFRPHEYLNRKTPAYMAGIRFPYRDWKDVVEQGYQETKNLQPAVQKFRV